MSGPVLNERVTYGRPWEHGIMIYELGTVLHIGESSFWVLLDSGPSVQFGLSEYDKSIEPVATRKRTIPGVAVNDHVCPSCKNDRCSKTERTCWKCGGALC